MNMTGYRPDLEAFVEPGITEGLIGGGVLQLVTVRLFTAPGDYDTPPPPDVFTRLRPSEARELAYQLLAAAEHAGQFSDQPAR